MKAFKNRRRRRVAPPPIPPIMHIDMDGDWRKFTRLLPKDCEVIGVVTIGGDDHGALVKVTGKFITEGAGQAPFPTVCPE